MVFFSVFLLFGAQIQHLWTAPAGDIVFDILAMITFAFFLVDMTIRIFVEPNYCNISFACGRSGYESRTCSLGSFMFWCDLASTGVILYEVSFINKPHYEVISIDIDLDDFGLPVSTDADPPSVIRVVLPTFSKLIVLFTALRLFARRFRVTTTFEDFGRLGLNLIC